MQTINLAEADVIRAGSDYLGVAWSISVAGAFNKGQTYHFIKTGDRGVSYEAVAVRREKLDGKMTTLFVDAEDVFVAEFM